LRWRFARQVPALAAPVVSFSPRSPAGLQNLPLVATS
jgi:hypothetical protein